MPTPEVHAFVRAALPSSGRILEIGAGAGELAADLAGAGYDVVAIDPAGGPPHVRQLPLLELDEPAGSFAAAVAVVSLHHVEPLRESLAHLAALLAPGAPLVVEEFDVGRLDARAAAWWIEQRRALGRERPHDGAATVAELRDHLHTVRTIMRELAPWFTLGEPVRGAYLYRWDLEPDLRTPEEQLIAAGAIPATGARFIATRGSRAPAAPPTPRG